MKYFLNQSIFSDENADKRSNGKHKVSKQSTNRIHKQAYKTKREEPYTLKLSQNKKLELFRVINSNTFVKGSSKRQTSRLFKSHETRKGLTTFNPDLTVNMAATPYNMHEQATDKEQQTPLYRSHVEQINGLNTLPEFLGVLSSSNPEEHTAIALTAQEGTDEEIRFVLSSPDATQSYIWHKFSELLNQSSTEDYNGDHALVSYFYENLINSVYQHFSFLSRFFKLEVLNSEQQEVILYNWCINVLEKIIIEYQMQIAQQEFDPTEQIVQQEFEDVNQVGNDEKQPLPVIRLNELNDNKSICDLFCHVLKESGLYGDDEEDDLTDENDDEEIYSQPAMNGDDDDDLILAQEFNLNL